jgi:hypothetical protein
MDPAAAADSLLDERLLSVVSHDILHTRQLPWLSRRLDMIRLQTPLPAGINDNIVQRTFSANAEFRDAFEAELELLYAAALEPDTAKAREQAVRAVDMIAARRAKFFTGDQRSFAVIEDLFLNMEGAAEWVRFRLHRTDARQWGSDANIVAFIRGTENDWVQDEGLAIYLLLDRFAPGWQERLLTPQIVSPVLLLTEAVKR